MDLWKLEGGKHVGIIYIHSGAYRHLCLCRHAVTWVVTDIQILPLTTLHLSSLWKV
jgi:hypothetical protein